MSWYLQGTKGTGPRGSSLMTGFKGGGFGGNSEVKNGLKLSQRKNPEYVMWGMVLGKQHPQEMRRFWLQGEGLNIYCCSPTPKIPATLLPRREAWGSVSWRLLFSCSSHHQHHLHFQKKESVKSHSHIRTVALQAPLSMGFFTQEYWSGLPFPCPGDLPDPGIKPRSPAL